MLLGQLGKEGQEQQEFFPVSPLIILRPLICVTLWAAASQYETEERLIFRAGEHIRGALIGRTEPSLSITEV